MKTTRNLLIAVVVLFSTIQLNAQQWTLSGTNIYNNNSGYVGIGTSNAPTNLLEVNRNMTGPQIIIHNLGGNGGAGFTMTDDKYSATWKFKAITGGGFKIRDNSNSLDVLVMEPNSAANTIYIQTGGNVGIGTSSPSSKLSVNGKIGCKEVEVTLTGWSDFVFAEDYQLRTLEEVEAYINENNHLPDVPSEKEVLENGVKVGEMNSTLLRKIEELTLYMIELKKENEQMKAQIEVLMEK